MSSELTVIARMQAKPDRVDELRAALDVIIAATREEHGCLNYDLHVHAEDPTVFAFHETWVDRVAWEEHNDTPHIAKFRALAGELLVGPAQVDPLHKVE